MNLNQVSLPVTDLERSAAFYRQLGFRQIVSSPPAYARFECPAGESTFSLHRVDHLDARQDAIIYFECEDVDALCRALTARGVTFEQAPADQPWLWREAYLRDPDGNSLCLYHAGRNRRFPPWRLPE